MIDKIDVYYTDHVINQTVTQFLAKNLNLNFRNIKNLRLSDDRVFCSYGILRGNDIAIKNSKNFIYIDHGYIDSSDRIFGKQTKINKLSGYFRVIANDLYFNSKYINNSNARFKSLSISLKDLNQKGSIIVLSEPSIFIQEYFNLTDWVNKTINLIKNYTDRKIIVHNKQSPIPLKEILKDAFAFVSYQSSAGYDAIIEGVPAYFLHGSLEKHGNIKLIESQNLNYELLYNASNFQWKLSEFSSDLFQNYISDLLLTMN